MTKPLVPDYRDHHSQAMVSKVSKSYLGASFDFHSTLFLYRTRRKRTFNKQIITRAVLFQQDAIASQLAALPCLSQEALWPYPDASSGNYPGAWLRGPFVAPGMFW